jgi:glucose dehydrogenase
MGWINLKNLDKLPPIKQKTGDSCWAARGSALSKYFVDQLKDGHYMIIIGVNDSNGNLYIMDPSQGNLQYSVQFNYSKNGYNDMRFAKTFYTQIPS